MLHISFYDLSNILKRSFETWDGGSFWKVLNLVEKRDPVRVEINKRYRGETWHRDRAFLILTSLYDETEEF